MSKPLTNSQKERAYRRKRRRRQTIALIFIALVLIGAGTILSALARLGISFFDDSGDKAAFAEQIAPVVALDPAPFSSIERADHDLLLQAAIWSALSTENLDKYEQTDTGLYLPAVDVERAIARIYGPNVTLTMRTITIGGTAEGADGNTYGLTIEYQSQYKRFLFPSTSQSGSYIPVIETITSSGNSTKTLLVAYTLDGATDDAGHALNVVKYMEYIMVKNGSSYYLYAVREPQSTATGTQAT